MSTYPPLNPENPSEADRSGLYIGSLDGMEPRFLQDARSRAVYSEGSLLYVDDGVLTVRFTYRRKKIRIYGAGYWRKGRKIYERKT